MVRAVPKSSISAVSSLRPVSSLMTVPPHKIAISSSIAFLRSPKPGAFTANMFNVPLSLLTTSVAKASPSTSSPITTTFFFPICNSFSKAGRKSATADIFLSVITSVASSITDSILSELVMK